ncbi:hypothetical protein LCGC14_0146770 [marine sediment metagenome]|uniref:Uncharacterized protein n=1 Tax=marine sediment metagenome TaxID=412755 RepID=A0A0F9V021_9ZZZZ
MYDGLTTEELHGLADYLLKEASAAPKLLTAGTKTIPPSILKKVVDKVKRYGTLMAGGKKFTGSVTGQTGKTRFRSASVKNLRATSALSKLRKQQNFGRAPRGILGRLLGGVKPVGKLKKEIDAVNLARGATAAGGVGTAGATYVLTRKSKPKRNR